MFKRWRKHLDKMEKCDALFVDLSETFDSLQTLTLLTKIYAHEFSYTSVKLISLFFIRKKI